MAIEEQIEKNILLAPFTTFKVGGPARLFIEVNDSSELVEAIRWAKLHNENFFILGGGSNILVSDSGFDGLVIKYNSKGLIVEKNTLVCEAGAALSRAVQLAKRHGLSGLEWATGLPGTIGGAIRGNAGAFGDSIGDFAEQVTAYDIDNDQLLTLYREECNFHYRGSLFKEKNLVVLGCILHLKRGQTDKIEAKMFEYINYRITHQPRYPSAGSIFKNINVKELETANFALYLEAKAEKLTKTERVSSGWVISKLHLKGKRFGGAMVSEEHANFIVNRNFEARAEEIIILISFIKQQARLMYNLRLVEEIQYVGF